MRGVLNRSKHGISRIDANAFDWDTAPYWVDRRRDYQEPRMCALGRIAGRVHVAVFVVRAGTLRMISLRKANPREERRYGKTEQGHQGG
ncbi:BrnT family toxin [Rugamonas apoptosis]|uniref:BrnT family toxin n=1 Tax=Rugamonas apoptosis TaxID=2758570 RepID=A0A7W2FEP5_9BURK|nr:BrnT family toxin [Rugamonas apoptosis]MBA5690252.1 BrnT family toxin [Rugamonas apoptosis]